MINRKIAKRIQSFFQKDHKALLITGARQVGKTYIIREIGKADFEKVQYNYKVSATQWTSSV